MLVVGLLVLGQIPPATLTFWTWLIAALSLLPFTWKHLKNSLPVIRREIVALFFYSLLGISGFQYLIFSGLLRSSAISASVLSPTIPIMVACLSWIVLGEKLRGVQILGVIISFVGTCWIATTGKWINFLELRIGPGESLVLAANLFIAAYTIMLRKYPTGLSPLAFMAVLALMGALQALPLSLMEIGFIDGATASMIFPLAILYIGLVNYNLAYLLWNLAVKRHGATMTAIFLYLIPIFGTILSMIFLSESLHTYHVIGVMFICAGLYLTLHLKAH